MWFCGHHNQDSVNMEWLGVGRTVSLGGNNFFTSTLFAFVLSSGLLDSQQTLLAWCGCCFIGRGWAKGTRRSFASWPQMSKNEQVGVALRTDHPVAGAGGGGPAFRVLDSPVYDNYQWAALMKRLRGWGGSTLCRLSVYCSGGCRALIFSFYSAWAWPQTGGETCWCLCLTEVGKVAMCFDNISSAFSARMWGLTTERCLCYYGAWNYRAELNPVFTWKKWIFENIQPSVLFFSTLHEPPRLAWWCCANCETQSV